MPKPWDISQGFCSGDKLESRGKRAEQHLSKKLDWEPGFYQSFWHLQRIRGVGESKRKKRISLSQDQIPRKTVSPSNSMNIDVILPPGPQSSGASEGWGWTLIYPLWPFAAPDGMLAGESSVLVHSVFQCVWALPPHTVSLHSSIFVF